MIDSYGASFPAEELLDTVVIRLAAIGADIQRRGARGDPVYADLLAEGHHHGYLNAAADVLSRRRDLI